MEVAGFHLKFVGANYNYEHPVLEYADIVWDNCTLHESNLLESVQVEAGRIITGLRIINFL
jgi:hypothetical protein